MIIFRGCLFIYLFIYLFQPSTKITLDHSHVKGLIRGRACNKHNLKHREQNMLPIICADLSAFDGRILMTAVGKYGPSNVKVIPYTSTDTYLSISVSRCRYLDSKRFLNASLDKLVESIMTVCCTNLYKKTSPCF